MSRQQKFVFGDFFELSVSNAHIRFEYLQKAT
mgnify:CR=1 FL=1